MGNGAFVFLNSQQLPLLQQLESPQCEEQSACEFSCDLEAAEALVVTAVPPKSRAVKTASITMVRKTPIGPRFVFLLFRIEAIISLPHTRDQALAQQFVRLPFSGSAADPPGSSRQPRHKHVSTLLPYILFGKSRTGRELLRLRE